MRIFGNRFRVTHCRSQEIVPIKKDGEQTCCISEQSDNPLFGGGEGGGVEKGPHLKVVNQIKYD